MLTDKHISLMEKVEKELDNSKLVFPTCFDLSLRIQKLINSEDINVELLSKLIQNEPVLAAKLYSIGNSAVHNPSGSKVTAIGKIIYRIGMLVVRFLSQAVIQEQLVRDTRSKIIRQTASDLWSYSADFSSWAATIAGETTIIKSDDMIFNTVMVNIGQFYILHKVQKFPELGEDLETLKEIVREWGPAVTSKIFSAYGISRKIVVDKENVEKKGFDWPLSTMADIVALASVMTELEDPFAKSITNLDDYIVANNVSKKDEAEIKEFVSEIKPARDKLFESITG